MSDLIEFLRARFDEDEAVAQQAASAKPGAHYSDASQVGAVWSADEGMVVGADDLWEDEGADSLAMDPAAAAHVARHDPARVLAECEAKRLIVDAYRDERSRRDVYQRADAMAVEDEKQRTSRRSSAARTRGLEIALEALALPYADHPDYREEWRP